MSIVICFYTTLIATINIVANTSSNLLPPGFDIDTLTPHEVSKREFGSKLILVVEQCQCVTIWGTKLCLILLYWRITTVHNENLAIKILFGYVVVTFVVMDILYFGVWCQPFHNYWAVPTPNKQCDAATNHLITNAVFNLTSDVAMLLIGLPMFLRMKLPWKKKIPLIGIFSLGIFTILSAVLNKWYSFTQPFGAQWTYWYVRESSTALLVANLPFVWTFWRRITGHPRSIKGASRNDSLSPQDALSKNGNGAGSDDNGKATSGPDGYEMKDSPVGRRMTFAEMLSDGTPSSIGDKEPSEITHPALFYTKNRGASITNNHQSSNEKAAFDDMEFQTIQGEGGSGSADHTPTSSVHPNLHNKESASSFV